MTDDDIRKRVRAGLDDGTLPRQTPVVAQRIKAGEVFPMIVESGVALGDACAVCGERSTQVRYNAPGGPIAFHDDCERILREEAGW